MKKNVQSKGHFKMYKAGKKWVSYGLSVMGVALVVGTPVMSATLPIDDARNCLCGFCASN